MTRRYLDVPYKDKDDAKALGARWDAKKKLWYTDDPGSVCLYHWPQKDKTTNNGGSRGSGGLFIDLIPSTSFFQNLRKFLSTEDWDKLRKTVYSQAGQRCETCGIARNPKKQVWLEAHERWEYDENTGTQKLVKLVCLCTLCHQATHYGLAQLNGKDREAREQLMRVNNWTLNQTFQHVEEAGRLWRERSQRTWALDMSLVETYGYKLKLS